MTGKTDWWRVKAPQPEPDETQPVPEHERPDITPDPRDPAARWWNKVYDADNGDTFGADSHPNPEQQTATVEKTDGEHIDEDQDQDAEPERKQGRLKNLLGLRKDDAGDERDDDNQPAPEGVPAPGPSNPGQVQATIAQPKQPRRAPREALLDWWDRLTPRQRAVLRDGAAAAIGAWGYGAFTNDWSTGIPQIVLGWMHDAATTSDSPWTPWLIGAGVTLGFSVVGAVVIGWIPAVGRLPTVYRTFHFLLIRIPAASAALATLLYATN